MIAGVWEGRGHSKGNSVEFGCDCSRVKASKERKAKPVPASYTCLTGTKENSGNRPLNLFDRNERVQR